MCPGLHQQMSRKGEEQRTDRRQQREFGEKVTTVALLMIACWCGYTSSMDLIANLVQGGPLSQLTLENTKEDSDLVSCCLCPNSGAGSF